MKAYGMYLMSANFVRVEYIAHLQHVKEGVEGIVKNLIPNSNGINEWAICSPAAEEISQVQIGNTKHVQEHRRRLYEAKSNLSATSKSVMVGFSALPTPANPFYCAGCKAAVEILRYHIRTGREDNIYSLVETTCTVFNIQSSNVCAGIARLFGPELVPILNSTVSAPVICSFLLSQECTKIVLPSWQVPLPPKTSETRHVEQPPPSNVPMLKVLHITDTHYDPMYSEGAKVNCPEPLCCRVQNGPAVNGEKGAGKWGDWNCDIPERTLDSMLEHAAKKNSDIDYIIWTGDIPAHDIWQQSKMSNLELLDKAVAKIKKFFPRVPVYAAVGNHEAAPTDIFPPPGATRSVSWLYEELDKQWRNWLPSDTSETVQLGGFYTTLIRPGFRMVSLNTNYCYHRNWWLMLNSTDPVDQLHWLVDVLKKAEDNKEKVHIIAHIAPGQSDCLPTWRDNFYRIASRFRNVITNYFYGHSHKDEFELYFDEENPNEAVGVGFLGPSVTTYVNLNPGYRVYYIDGDRENSTRAVLDYENWVLDLERSNRVKEPKWGRSYKARSEYGMKTLSPKEWNNLYENMKTSDYLFQLYYRTSTCKHRTREKERKEQSMIDVQR
ncbi:hypothetical protein RUM44_002595 [Polyplax serrata]|uniref:Sphingomyelin phosphodiesterase n=1 Tax=Polyplax serrata TaxID=468196 RepID=A0ABR1AF80_POLSC